MQSIYDLNMKMATDMLAEKGQKSYRAKQLFQWLYRKRVGSFQEMTDMPASLLEDLAQEYSIEPVKEITRQVARDGTTKYLFQLADGSSVETVLMHFHFGESLCVTSQLGCNMGCTFCASGLLKKQRDLTAGEIVGQVMFVQKELDKIGKRVDNVVIMGTGEPFDNYDNVMRFCEIINSDLRRKLMPIDQAYPLDVLMDALHEYSEGNNRRITFEYILLHGVNDTDVHAIQLANLIRGMNAYVNLIPYNQVDENGYVSTNEKVALHFYDVLMKHGVKATLRSKHGDDIDAACGQLRAKHEKGKL